MRTTIDKLSAVASIAAVMAMFWWLAKCETADDDISPGCRAMSASRSEWLSKKLGGKGAAPRELGFTSMGRCGEVLHLSTCGEGMDTIVRQQKRAIPWLESAQNASFETYQCGDAPPETISSVLGL